MTSVSIAGIDLEHPLLNAAGTAKSITDVRRLARSAVAAVTIGSITLEARGGNSGQVFYRGEGYSLNALGLPNPGGEYYQKHLPEMRAICASGGKPLILSVAAFAPEEYAELSQLAAANGADLLELNLGCPNVYENGKQHRIASFDPDLVAAIVAASVAQSAVPVGVKLSPFSDPALLQEVAAVLSESEVSFVVASNTFANGRMHDDAGRVVLSAGYGGVSGPALLPLALGQVAQLREGLPRSISIIGVGGVGSGSDVLMMQQAGADAVGIATRYWNAKEDAGVFSDLLADWLQASQAD